MKKEKYLQIFRYLLEFSKIRSNPVRNIAESAAQYPEKVWFEEIPENPLFDCVTFAEYNVESEFWLKIRKPTDEPTEPEFAKLSKTLNEWVVESSLTDENGIPFLHSSITKNNQVLELTDHPNIGAEFQQYLDNKWLDDFDEFQEQFSLYEIKLAEFEKLNNIYKRFFGIYNKAKQFGEEYELVVGIGLLNFKAGDNSPHIYRHVLTSKVEILPEYSQNETFLTVSPSPDSEIIVEKDAIIDLVELFESQNIIDAENGVSAFLAEKEINDIFNENVKDALQIFARRIHVDGDFVDDINRPKNVSKKPLTFFSPAILLRKRNTRSFTALYEKIIEDLESATDDLNIPSLNELIGVYEQHSEGGSDQPSTPTVEITDETIYFPKKFNAEQVQIIHKAKTNDKVLVQGPPGTGKSHTIANLICHLLAKGKRVLVTAYTEQALGALKRQLPPQTRNLAVTLMGGDASSIQDLKASVTGINQELADWDIDGSRSHIEKLHEKLSEINERIAFTTNEWLSVKESSTRRQVINDAYHGTLLEIAERLEKDSEEFQWFNDSYSSTDNLDIIHDVENYVTRLKGYDNVDCTPFDQFIPDNEHLLSIEELREYLRIVDEVEQGRQLATASLLIDSVDLDDLKSDLEALFELYVSIERNSLPFKSKLISEYVLNISEWTKRIRETKSLLADLSGKGLRELDQNLEIVYPSDKSLIQLKNDARHLLDFLNEGNRLEGLRFKIRKGVLPKAIKEKLGFIDSVWVNGSECDTIPEFVTVINDLEIKQLFLQLADIWSLNPEKDSGKYFNAEKFYFELNEETTSLIRSIDESIGLKAKIESKSNVRIHSTESVKIEQLIESVNFNSLLREENLLKARLVAAKQYLNLPNSHTISQTLLEDLDQLNISSYEVRLAALSKLRSEQQNYREFKAFETDLKIHFPILVEDIRNGIVNAKEINQLRSAIHFRNAQTVVSEMLEAGYESELIRKLNDLEHRKEQTIEKLATRKAWLHVLLNLESNRSLRKFLDAWVQAVKSIGKTGRGKKALKFRKIAQSHMEQCKDSIPCWIMPLYKVAETVKPEMEMYDYVIIDEASQLGPDAIFLLYISKNVIIVGDDKQTSPEYVGVNADTMTPYISQHLRGIPFKDHYDINFSFFDHARLFCEGLIVLREHFRCMPEIIEFSNRYFYAPEGNDLYPLKQYSENRMEPLKSVFCRTGNTSGHSQNISNKVEAQAIADKVAELVSDDRYEGKTFGIIALQGNVQAALINSFILRKIDEREYLKRDIKYGNSAAFQGDERDVMFLSLITAHNHNRSALTRNEDERRFNVAASRAKEQMWLFHSVQMEDLNNKNDLRYKLLDHFLNYKPQEIPLQREIRRTMGSQPAPFESWFEVDVFNDIVAKGYKVIPQYEVARGKYRIDLVSVLPNGTKIAIECDGDKVHGAEQYEYDLMRQKVLERCGWQFFRVRGGEYYSDRQGSMDPLWKLLGTNDFESSGPPSALDSPVELGESLEVPEFPEYISIDAESKQQALFEFESRNAEYETHGLSTGVARKIKSSSIESFDLILEFLVFTSKNNVYKVRNEGFSNISQVLNRVEAEPGEDLIYITGTKDYSEFLIVGFKNGKIGKIRMESFRTEFNRRRLRNAYSDESTLIFIELFRFDIDLVAISSINKVMIFSTAEINPVASRQSNGVKVMNSKDGSYLVEVRKTSSVSFENPEYYRKHIPAIGNFLLKQDSL